MDKIMQRRYSILGFYDRYSRPDALFSNTPNDPVLAAELDASSLSDGYPYHISVAIDNKGNVVTQIIIFKDKESRQKALMENEVIFLER